MNEDHIETWEMPYVNMKGGMHTMSALCKNTYRQLQGLESNLQK